MQKKTTKGEPASSLVKVIGLVILLSKLLQLGRCSKLRPSNWSLLKTDMISTFRHTVVAAFGFIYAPLAWSSEPVPVIPPAQKVLSSEGGRYVFGQINDLRRDQFMLDTKTGRLWRVVVAKYKKADGTEVAGDGYSVLEAVVYEDLQGNRMEYPKEVVPQPPQAKAK